MKSDVEWLAHNLKTKETKPKLKKDQAEKIAQEIVKALDQEIKNAMACQECYENAFNNPAGSMSMTCVATPHLLVWANAESWEYLPAKIMKYNDHDGDIVDVRFFGDYTNASIPLTDCYLFSKEVPIN